MKKLLFIALTGFLCSLGAISFAQNETSGVQYYGTSFYSGTVYAPDRIPELLNGKSEAKDVQLAGVISEVCQKEGCWIKINTSADSHENILVKTNHEFLLPKDVAGKKVLILGTISEKEVSVKEQQHLLEDAGASQEEMDKVVAPKKEYVVRAEGIQVFEQ